MTAIDEQTYYSKLQAIRDIKGRTIQLDKLKNRIYREIENTDAEEKSLAEYRREMEMLLQEKMSHVEELRQIHADINAMETVIKQAEENRARSLNVANKIHEEYVPLKNEIDHMRHEYLGLSPIPDLHEEEGTIVTAEYSTILQKLLDLRLKQNSQTAHFSRFQAAASSAYYHHHQHHQHTTAAAAAAAAAAAIAGGNSKIGGVGAAQAAAAAAAAAAAGGGAPLGGGAGGASSFARPPLSVNSSAAAAAGAHHPSIMASVDGSGQSQQQQQQSQQTAAGLPPSANVGGNSGGGGGSGGFLPPPPNMSSLRLNKPPDMGGQVASPQRLQQQPSIGMAHPTFRSDYNVNLRQQPPPMKSCLSCHQQIHRNAPICPLCKAKSRSRNPKKPKKKDH